MGRTRLLFKSSDHCAFPISHSPFCDANQMKWSNLGGSALRKHVVPKKSLFPPSREPCPTAGSSCRPHSPAAPSPAFISPLLVQPWESVFPRMRCFHYLLGHFLASSLTLLLFVTAVHFWQVKPSKGWEPDGLQWGFQLSLHMRAWMDFKELLWLAAQADIQITCAHPRSSSQSPLPANYPRVFG